MPLDLLGIFKVLESQKLERENSIEKINLTKYFPEARSFKRDEIWGGWNFSNFYKKDFIIIYFIFKI